ncbi:xanthine dehydrogenase family protein molybdopterin-binding subunit [Haladaptatus sp. CMSO5]|uniref:xanthine dehydrogenase family protein molybdopterin-binding subunit n=1 Tax=Haladaptatus sp. CMSO5 TaxID=3120514 RepID=UPI002FCE5978
MSKSLQKQSERKKAYSSVSKHVERIDGKEKVDGTVEYGDDLVFPDVKHVKLCRATIPHGKLVDVDPSAALELPGVRRVITRKDIYELQDEIGYNPYYGPAIKDQPVLALDKVHYIGDPVAAVIADERDIAEEAIDLIDVTYDEMDFCEDVDDALADDAPIIHEEFEAADTFPDLEQVEGGRDTNEAFQFNLRYGDVDAALEEAAHVFENTYRSPPVQHMPFEPFVATARANQDGTMEIWTPNQSPHFVRNEIASMFNMPQSKVRVRVPQVGGSYGMKLYAKTEPIIALCAYLTDETVKLKMDIEESFSTITRHGTKIVLKTGVADDGTILGRKCDVYYDTGAYAEIGPRITKKSGYTAAGPYEIENVSIDSHCVYTNKPPAGAFRGFGVPQLVTAYEAQMETIAVELGLDPTEYRKRLGYKEGSTHPTSVPVKSVGLVECIEAVEEAMEWDKPLEQPDDPALKRGRAIACGYKACITPSSSGALVIVSGDGSVTVHSSSVEIGQGVKTTLAQLVCEGFGIDIDYVDVAQPDTATSPFDTITAGSRTTFHMGNAVMRAVDDAKDQMRGIAARTWGVAANEITVEDGVVSHADSGNEMSLGDAVKAEFGKAGGTLLGRGYFTTEGGHHDPETGQADKVTVFWFFGATGAVVDVDTETGKVYVRELQNAADVGQAIDPDRVRGQILGGAAHALGQSLHEEMVFDYGQQTNQQLLDYKVPSFRDMPEKVGNHIVEVDHPDGPYGAKGVGETGSFAVSPAIGNAILNATGADVKAIPYTPERVLDAVQEAEDQ